MKSSEIIKTVRLALGLSQSDLARLLVVTRVHLSLAELGKRQLPASRFVKIVQIFNALPSATTMKRTDGTDEGTKEALQKQLLHLRYKASKLKDKINKLQEEKNLPRQDFSGDLSALKATAIFDETWLHHVKSKLAKHQSKAPTGNEHDLRMQLVALEAQVKYLEEVTR